MCVVSVMSRHGPLDLVAVAVLGASAGFVVATPAIVPEAVRALVALLLFFVFLGYASQAALMPHIPMPSAEGVMVALGLALSVTIITGLFINLVPGGFDRSTWAFTIGALTVVASLIGIRRRPPVSRARTQLPPLPVVMTMAVAGVLAAASAVIAIAGVAEQPRPGFTQLWLLPGSDPSSVTVGIRNESGQVERLSVRLQLDGDQVAAWPAITLVPGETWTADQALPEAPDAGSREVEAILTRAREPATELRRVDLEMGS